MTASAGIGVCMYIFTMQTTKYKYKINPRQLHHRQIRLLGWYFTYQVVTSSFILGIVFKSVGTTRTVLRSYVHFTLHYCWTVYYMILVIMTSFTTIKHQLTLSLHCGISSLIILPVLTCSHSTTDHVTYSYPQFTLQTWHIRKWNSFTIENDTFPRGTAQSAPAEANESGTAFFGSRSPRLVANAGAADRRGGFNCKAEALCIHSLHHGLHDL